MRRALLGLASLSSGIAALVWQILWIRRLSEAFGHSAYAVNAVLAIFFCGLGLGAWIFGRASDRRNGSIGLYCGLEAVIAAAGLGFGPACDAVERGELASARKAAETLGGCDGQQHAGLYLLALLARRTGDLDEARRLARAALVLKPDHRASRELLTEIGDPVAR